MHDSEEELAEQFVGRLEHYGAFLLFIILSVAFGVISLYTCGLR